MEMVTIRLRALRGGAVNMYVRGVKFVAGEWTDVPEVLPLEGGGEFPLVAYVSSLRDAEDRRLFEMAPAAPEEPAVEVEAPVAEVAAEAASDGKPADTGDAATPDDGKETVTREQLEAELAERAAVEAAQRKAADAGMSQAEGTGGAAPASEAQPTGRRAQRLARRKAAKEPAAG